MSAVDLSALVFGNRPAEWGAVPDLSHVKLDPRSGFLAEAHANRIMAEMEKVQFLVRNTFNWKCETCGAGSFGTKGHEYITKACISRPVRGIRDVEALYKRLAGTDIMLHVMQLGEQIVPISPAEAARLWKRIYWKAGPDALRKEQQRARRVARWTSR